MKQVGVVNITMVFKEIIDSVVTGMTVPW